MHGDKELIEKLGRNDLCPCGSARRFQELLHENEAVRRRAAELLHPGKVVPESPQQQGDRPANKDDRQ